MLWEHGESLDNEACNFLVRKLKVSMSSTDCRTTVGQHDNIVWSSEQLCTLFWDVSLVCFPQVLFQILRYYQWVSVVVMLVVFDSFLHVLVHTFFLVSFQCWPIQWNLLNRHLPMVPLTDTSPWFLSKAHAKSGPRGIHAMPRD